jgi:hypothetical protein
MASPLQPPADPFPSAGSASAGAALTGSASAGSAPPDALGNLVVAHFRRVETAMLAHVLVTTLAGALPPSMVRVERRRSLGGRLARRPGEPVGVSVLAADSMLTFRTPALGLIEASVSHVVHGVVLSTTPTTVAEWLDQLSALLTEIGQRDETTRAALERFLVA